VMTATFPSSLPRMCQSSGAAIYESRIRNRHFLTAACAITV